MIRGSPHSYKELSGDNLSTHSVNKRETIGVIYEDFFTGAVFLAHAVVRLITPVAVIIAELSILITVGMVFLVFDPQLVLVGSQLIVDIMAVQ
jgi:hypothetical protein